MEIIKLREEFIKLGQALKAAGLVESGVEAKEVIQEGLVMVNGEVDTCLLYTSPSPRDGLLSRMTSYA